MQSFQYYVVIPAPPCLDWYKAGSLRNRNKGRNLVKKMTEGDLNDVMIEVNLELAVNTPARLEGS